MYADDILLFCKGRDITTTQQLLQTTLLNLHSWSYRTGLRFSPSKSKCILFSRLRNPTQDLELVMDNHRIPTVTNVRILGLHFDRRLNWIVHLKMLKAECMRCLNFLKVLSAKSWGADSNILLRTYKTIIRPKLDYGSIIYNSASATSLKMLDGIQSSALRISLGAFHTSPIDSLQIETNEPSLHIRRKTLSLLYSPKIATRPDSMIYPYIFLAEN